MAKKKAPPKKASPAKTPRANSEVDKLKSQLKQANEELANVRSFFEELQKFSELVANAKSQQGELEARELVLKNELGEVRDELRSVRNLINSSNDGMLSIIVPGPSNFLPLFDRMEEADPKTHGKNSVVWREQPIAVLRLSPLASKALIEADILFIGQLQDLVVADPDDWWDEINGMTDAVAAAVADKLNDFVSKGGMS